LTTDTQAASDDEQKEIEIKNILLPIDGSEYSLHAAKYATRIARNEKAQLFCIHVVTPQRFKFFHRARIITFTVIRLYKTGTT